MNTTTKTIVLKNAAIIDGTGAATLPHGAVIIEGNRIKEVVSGEPGRIPADAEIIDCQRHTLLPGLIDAHSHMNAVDVNLEDLPRRNFPSMIIIRALKIAKETLEQGFTTVRDCCGVDAGFRDAIAQGLVPGPRLFVSGTALSQTGGHADVRLPAEMYMPLTGIYDGVDAVRKAARDQIRQGVDFIKVMGGGGCMSPSDEIDTSQYSLDELKAIVFEAQAVNKYVSAHVYAPRSIMNCLQAGVRTLEHGNFLDEKTAQAIKDAGAYLVPTLATYEVTGRMSKELAIPEYSLKKMLAARDKSLEALAIAHRVGVKIASGSDLLGVMQQYKGMELELKAKVLGPMGAIVAATKTNAELLLREKDLGTLEAGKLADVILVNGDPLKDITLFQHYHENISLIMQAGNVYKNILK